MGQNDILDELIRRGDVPFTDLCNKFKPHGQISRQLKALRGKGLADRKLVNDRWVWFPTAEALGLEGVIA